MYLEEFFSNFLNSKESGLSLSPIYLLIGCALPVWLEEHPSIIQHSGIILLGIGDTFASVIGSKFGRIKWPRSKKTIEGTLAFIISTLLVFNAFAPLTLKITISIILTALLEGNSNENDNLFAPLYFYTLNSLLSIK